MTENEKILASVVAMLEQVVRTLELLAVGDPISTQSLRQSIDELERDIRHARLVAEPDPP